MAFARTVIAAAAIAAAAAAGCAAPPPGAPALTEAQKGAVLGAARAVLASGSCPAATAGIADAPVRLEDPRLGGALRQPVRVEGCGRSGRLNMLVVPATGGGGGGGGGGAAAGVATLLPGTTAAEPPLQREGLRLAIMAVKDAAPGCDRITAVDTRVEGAAAGPARPWNEVWLLSACGRAFAVPVRFAPGRDGTEITVDPGGVRPPA